MSPYDQDISTLETWIENRRILIAVRYIDKFSIEKIERDGVYKTGWKDHDRDVHNQLNEFYEKPLEIVRMVCEGRPVVIRQEKDSKWLYEVFNSYLTWWGRQAARGVNTGLINAELMLRIDEFLKILFPFANRQQVVSSAPDIFNIAGLSRRPDHPAVRIQSSSVQDASAMDDLVNSLGAVETSPGEYVVRHISQADVFEKVAYENLMRAQKNV